MTRALGKSFKQIENDNHVDFQSLPTKGAIRRRLLCKSKTNPDGCLEWQGSISVYGYGDIRIEKKTYRVHRVSYSIFNGNIPKGLFVLHKCDNRKCINPDHLFVGTPKDNVVDMMSKNRHAYREKNGHAKLTDTDINEIRKLSAIGLSQSEMSIIFSVNQSNISRILSKEAWNHV